MTHGFATVVLARIGVGLIALGDATDREGVKVPIRIGKVRRASYGRVRGSQGVAELFPADRILTLCGKQRCSIMPPFNRIVGSEAIPDLAND